MSRADTLPALQVALADVGGDSLKRQSMEVAA
jgi:hypothetical protein